MRQKAGVEYTTFRNALVNFKKNKGSLQIFLKYCYLLGYKIDFILINRDNGEVVAESGMSAGSIIKKVMMIKKITAIEIAEKIDITSDAVNKRIKQLSINVGNINKLIEIAEIIGYRLEIAFIK